MKGTLHKQQAVGSPSQRNLISNFPVVVNIDKGCLIYCVAIDGRYIYIYIYIHTYIYYFSQGGNYAIKFVKYLSIYKDKRI